MTGISDIVTAHSEIHRKSVTVISELPVTPSESAVTLFRNRRSRCLGIRNLVMQMLQAFMESAHIIRDLEKAIARQVSR